MRSADSDHPRARTVSTGEAQAGVSVLPPVALALEAWRHEPLDPSLGFAVERGCLIATLPILFCSGFQATACIGWVVHPFLALSTSIALVSVAAPVNTKAAVLPAMALCAELLFLGTVLLLWLELPKQAVCEASWLSPSAWSAAAQGRTEALAWALRFWLRCSHLQPQFALLLAADAAVLAAAVSIGAPLRGLERCGAWLAVQLLVAALHRAAWWQDVWRRRPLRALLAACRHALSRSRGPRRAGAEGEGAEELRGAAMPTDSDALPPAAPRHRRPRQSPAAPGSVWLTLRLLPSGVEPRSALDLRALVQTLQSACAPSRALRSIRSVQHGEAHFSFRGEQGGTQTQVLPPVVLSVEPSVLPAGRQVPLRVRVRVRGAGDRPPAGQVLLLRSPSHCVRINLPKALLGPAVARGTSCTVTHEVVVAFPSTVLDLEVYRLEVCDKALFSQAVPLAVCSDHRLANELQTLLVWSQRRQPEPTQYRSPGGGPADQAASPMSSSIQLLAVCDLAEFLRCWAAQAPHQAAALLRGRVAPGHANAAQANGAGHGGAAAEAAALLHRVAEAARCSCPPLLALAAALGLPHLMRLLLLRISPAFLPGLRAAGSSSAASSEQAALQDRAGVVQPAGGRGDGGARGAALGDLLIAAAVGGPLVSTVLHSIMAAGCPATLQVLQEQVQAAGLELDWHAPLHRSSPRAEAAAGTPAGGEGAEARHVPSRWMTPLELAAGGLPRTMEVCSEALAGSSAAASAWLEQGCAQTSWRRLQADGRRCAAALQALAGRTLQEEWRQRWHLTFAHAQLEQGWAQRVGRIRLRLTCLSRIFLVTCTCACFLLDALKPREPASFLTSRAAMYLLSYLGSRFPNQCSWFLALSQVGFMTLHVCQTKKALRLSASSEMHDAVHLLIANLLGYLFCPMPFRYQLPAAVLVLFGRPGGLAVALSPGSVQRLWHVHAVLLGGNAVWLTVQWLLEARSRRKWKDELLAALADASLTKKKNS